MTESQPKRKKGENQERKIAGNWSNKIKNNERTKKKTNKWTENKEWIKQTNKNKQIKKMNERKKQRISKQINEGENKIWHVSSVCVKTLSVFVKAS